MRPTFKGKLIPICHIQKVISEITKVPVRDILADNHTPGARKRETITARHLCMYFSCIYTKYSLARIGMEHGYRDHATVLHACDSINNLVDTNDYDLMQHYPAAVNRFREYVRTPKIQKMEERSIILKAFMRNKVPINIRHRVLYEQYN